MGVVCLITCHVGNLPVVKANLLSCVEVALIVQAGHQIFGSYLFNRETFQFLFFAELEPCAVVSVLCQLCDCAHVVLFCGNERLRKFSRLIAGTQVPILESWLGTGHRVDKGILVVSDL